MKPGAARLLSASWKLALFRGAFQFLLSCGNSERVIADLHINKYNFYIIKKSLKDAWNVAVYLLYLTHKLTCMGLVSLLHSIAK